MQEVRLPLIGTVAAWRDHARRLAASGVAAEAVLWLVGQPQADLFAPATPPAGSAVPRETKGTPAPSLTISKAALQSIETALCHSDPQRFARAYDIVLRLSRQQLRWGDRSDPALHRLLAQEKSVRRDIHKMHAFVRFREVTPPQARRRAFAAWFEPDHPIVEAACPFFAKRFGDMDWVIATPTLTARFIAQDLSFEETRDRAAPPADATEALWRTYFTNIFNPARLMVSAMTSQMPRKYWKNLPEADLIPEMIRQAPARARAMQDAMPTLAPAHVARIKPQRPLLTAQTDLASLKPALDACRHCPIGACATQGVAGEGPGNAAVMIVGEQPGDAEDMAGRPFVGPAGQVFNRCAKAAALPRDKCYVTNAVKHFKFQPRGKRRLHERPTQAEVLACLPWLELERRQVQPKLLVAMGATAAFALTGSDKSILSRRGQIEKTADGCDVLVTLHPSYVLRQTDPQDRARAEALLVADLARINQILSSPTP